MARYRLHRQGSNPATLAEGRFNQCYQSKLTIPTHETSKNSSSGKDEVVEEKTSSEILEKPPRCSSVREGAIREMLWIVWDPTPGRSLVKDRDLPRIKF